MHMHTSVCGKCASIKNLPADAGGFYLVLVFRGVRIEKHEVCILRHITYLTHLRAAIYAREIIFGDRADASRAFGRKRE